MSKNKLGFGRQRKKVNSNFVVDGRGQCDLPLTRTDSFKSEAEPINFAKHQLFGIGGCFNSEIRYFSISNIKTLNETSNVGLYSMREMKSD